MVWNKVHVKWRYEMQHGVWHWQSWCYSVWGMEFDTDSPDATPSEAWSLTLTVLMLLRLRHGVWHWQSWCYSVWGMEFDTDSPDATPSEAWSLTLTVLMLLRLRPHKNKGGPHASTPGVVQFRVDDSLVQMNFDKSIDAAAVHLLKGK